MLILLWQKYQKKYVPLRPNLNYVVLRMNRLDYVQKTGTDLFLFFTKCLLISFVLFSACHKPQPIQSSISYNFINTRVSDDSLLIMIEHFSNENNPRGLMLVYKEMGRRKQAESNFSSSLELCKKTVAMAEQVGDTIEIMNSLNNIGTCLRRMGVMGEASSAFYKSLSIFEEYSQKTIINAKKCRLVALNSIGNINKTLGNFEAADSLFHIALSGALELNDTVGAAINTANIGLIFQDRNQYDSAWVYLRRSMNYNIEAGYEPGITITHVNYGRLYELQGDLDNALREFEIVINDTQTTSNRWQWLMSCISYARIQIRKGNLNIARPYLEKAWDVAKDIRSLTHLSEVSRLYYMYYEKNHNYSKALDYHVMHRTYADSLRSNESREQIQNLREQYAIEQNQRELTTLTNNYNLKQQSKNRILVIGGLALILSVAALFFLGYALRMRARSHKVMKDMEKIRSDFFTNITHEFRTPLTVILGLSKQLQEETNNDETTDSLKTIIRQGNTLLSLVNQLLDISKTQSAIGKPEWCSGNIIIHIEMIIESYRIYAKQKQIELLFEHPKEYFEMDFAPEYLKKVLRNLLSNALKYTPLNGQIQISAIKEKDSLILKIKDTGVGISAEDLPYIFEAFYQTKQKSLDTGSGIGLALVAQIVKRINGSITVQSTLDEGTEFTVILPLKQGKYTFEKWVSDGEYEEQYLIEEPHNQITSPNNTEKPTILIIDDNTDVSFYIGSLLKNSYHLIYAENGKEGLEKAEKYLPDLIVTDLMMPEIDGYTLCSKVRSSMVINHIPIVIISAKVEESDRIYGFEVGADAYLQKPFNSDELLVLVAKLLEQRQLMREKFSNALKTDEQQSIELTPFCNDFVNLLNEVIDGQINNSELNSNFIADKLYLSRSQLNRKVLSITGANTTSYILRIRLNKAKSLLVSTQKSISDIALECGFNDLSYFSRAFKHEIGDSPKVYRSKH